MCVCGCVWVCVVNASLGWDLHAMFSYTLPTRSAWAEAMAGCCTCFLQPFSLLPMSLLQHQCQLIVSVHVVDSSPATTWHCFRYIQHNDYNSDTLSLEYIA